MTTRNPPDLPFQVQRERPAPVLDPAPKPARTAGGDKPTPPTPEDLDQVHQRRIEEHVRTVRRGQIAVANAIASAPGLMDELRKLRDRTDGED